MQNNTLEFHKRQMKDIESVDLWLMIHNQPSGIMGTNVSNEKIRAAVLLIQERVDGRINELESRINYLEGTKKVQVESNVVGKRGRPKKVTAN